MKLELIKTRCSGYVSDELVAVGTPPQSGRVRVSLCGPTVMFTEKSAQVDQTYDLKLSQSCTYIDSTLDCCVFPWRELGLAKISERRGQDFPQYAARKVKDKLWLGGTCVGNVEFYTTERGGEKWLNPEDRVVSGFVSFSPGIILAQQRAIRFATEGTHVGLQIYNSASHKAHGSICTHVVENDEGWWLFSLADGRQMGITLDWDGLIVSKSMYWVLLQTCSNEWVPEYNIARSGGPVLMQCIV